MTRYDRSNISNFMHWLGLAMVAAYVGLGIYVLFTDNLNYIEKNVRFVFGFLFIALGAFRGARWMLKHKSRKYYEDTDIQDF